MEIKKQQAQNEDLDIKSSSSYFTSSQASSRFSDNTVNLDEIRRIFNIQAEQDTFELAKKEILMNHADPKTQNQELSVEQAKSNFDYYILFLDPESQIYYRKIIGRDDFIRLETLEEDQQENDFTPKSSKLSQRYENFYNKEEPLKKRIQQKNIKTLVEITKMLLLDGFSWTFVGEADSYRRRPFPLKFLQYECSDYPVYVFNSELSKAFNSIDGIETIVDLSEYADQIKIKDPRAAKQALNKFEYRNKESLVTSTNEFIKNIIRDVFKRYRQTRLTPKDSHILTLKVDGYREYLAGNYQLLQYERVRQCLRKNAQLKLILTEINLNFRDQYFPPIFKMEKTITYPIIYVRNFKIEMKQKILDEWYQKQQRLAIQHRENEQKALQNINKRNNDPRGTNNQQFGRTQNMTQNRQDQKNAAQKQAELEEEAPKDYKISKEEATLVLEENKYNKFMDRIDFEELQDSSQLLWYSPVPNLQQVEQRLLIKKNRLNFSNKDEKERPRIDVRNGLSQKDLIEMRWVDVPIEKKKVSITKHRFLNGGTTSAKNNEQVVVESGECNYMFRFKIISLERITKIFDEIRKPVATDNLETELRNVTLNHHKVINKLSKQEKKENKKQKKEQTNHEKLNMNQADQIFEQLNIELNEEDEIEANKIIAQNTKSEKDKQIQNKQQIKKIEDYDLPKLLKFSLNANKFRQKMIDENLSNDEKKQIQKCKELWQLKNFKKIHKKKLYGVDEDIYKYFQQYKKNNFEDIQTPFCNFSDSNETLEKYKNILRFSIGNFTPMKIKIQFDLFHGCEKLVQNQVIQEVYFSNNIQINKWTDFGNLRYCQLPVKTRLSINVILVFREPGFELTIGCVSMNLFDEKKKFRSGVQNLNIWPFYQIDERLGCMKEYCGREFKQDQDREQRIKNIHNDFAKIILQFESFIFPMYYSSRDLKLIEQWGLILNEDDENDKTQMLQNEIKQINTELAQLKKCFAKNPLSPLSDEEKNVLFRTREHYQSYPQGLPMFLRSVQWHRPLLVNETYKILKNWAPMNPEQAISLLDAKFPDEKVRQYAVNRISYLSDDDLALYMLQFSQALLYEEQHFSPLSDMLIERSLKNPYVVGQSFFWALKSNLYLKPSYERYYLLLEQFLMLCGKFRNEFLTQIKVNKCLQTVQENIMKNRYGHLELKEYPWTINLLEKKQKKESNSKDKQKKKDEKKDIIKKCIEQAREDLKYQKKYNMPDKFNFAIDPKYIIQDFMYEKIIIFNSKKVPLRLVNINAQPGGIDNMVLFKNGDDLRQDILTLQIIQIMDKIWLSNNLDLKMTPYKVTGTHCMQGFLEFVGNCKTLAQMQYEGTLWPFTNEANVLNTYNDDSVMKFMNKETRKRVKKQMEIEIGGEDQIKDKQAFEDRLNERTNEELEKIREVFSKSTAGYCVASYILGLGDRHPDNIMINFVEGNFLHIDFGHFLGNVKEKFGIKRERDPFVLTPEIAYFINGGPMQVPWYKRMFGQNNSQQIPQQIQSMRENDDSSKRRQTVSTNKSSTFKSTAQLLSNNDFQGQETENGSNYYNDFEQDEDSPQKEKFNKTKINQKEEKKKNENQEIIQMQGIYFKSKSFLRFEEDCCKAYNILRKEGDQLVNLFLLMLSAGMPELNHEKDIEFLVKKLNFGMTEQEANKLFKKEIINAIQTSFRRFDNLIHNIKAAHF